MNFVNKKNIYILALFVICLLMIVIVPTYAKFASNYVTGDDIVGLTLDFDIGISNIEEYEELVIPAGGSETFNIEITNSSGDLAYYGIWYKMVEPSTLSSDISIGRLEGTTVATSGSIENVGVTTATIAIINNSSSQITINIGVASSTTSTSDIEYLGGKYLITGTVAITRLLNEMEVGSYVAYTGNNGCSGEACNGQNINYVSDSNMGYCASSSDKYTVNGWRIGYIENGSVYLVSAGATDCICSDSTNEVQNVTGEVTGIVCADSLSVEDLPKYYDNMDSLALGYCNTNFAYGGQCNSSSAWAMDETDFGKITSSTLSSCYGLSSNACGNNNDLINNGGYYWFASQYLSYGDSFIWEPSSRYVYSNSSYAVRGVRPILRLANSVSVIGGTGTYADPYVITN